MIIIQLTGGLGNQMFQYAAAQALAERHGVELLLDTSSFLTTPRGKKNIRQFDLGNFNITPLFTKPRWHWIKKYFKARTIYPGMTHFREKHVEVHPEYFDLQANTYMEGVFHSEKYFAEIKNIIRNDFRFKPSLSETNADFINRMLSCNSVSLHVRRGDYVSNAHTNAMHGTTSLDYYMNAVKFIGKKVSDPIFFLFSDDPAWVIDNLQINYPYEVIKHNTGSSSFEDMRLMSNCKHHIIANSSFSWWGAWLNPSHEKIVIAPKQWFQNPDWNDKDIVPENWIKL